jgi:hypothetical protein
MNTRRQLYRHREALQLLIKQLRNQTAEALNWNQFQIWNRCGIYRGSNKKILQWIELERQTLVELRLVQNSINQINAQPEAI